MLWSLSICLLSFIFLFLMSLVLGFLGGYFLMMDLVYFVEWELISLNSSSVVMAMLFDWMSLLFMSFVLGISSLVIYYSEEYMLGDENLNRFIILVLMFVLSMMFLIISPNLISILLGWDGLGLVSYLLVIYYQNIKSYNAGMLTVLSNRIGDVALMMSIAWMLNFGSWNYIYYLDLEGNFYELKVVGGMVLLAAMTKSAQIPFSSWLPAAMAAPTPVSALVHSSTLVTAGVYLLIRFNFLINGSFWGNLLLLIAGLTMFMAGIGANYEFDLKSIIALSTLSQLGLMMGILSIGYYSLAFFHLLTHALFKALLFMCAGVIIHNMKNFQDIRYMGGICHQMPLTSSCLNISNLALCGLPFLAGFYSKDLILEAVSLSPINFFIFFLFFFSTGLTVSYSLRLVYYSMTGDFNMNSLHSVSGEGWVMLSGMMVLMLLAVMGGSMLSWMIFCTPEVINLPLFLKMLTLIVCLMGGWIGYEISSFALSYNLFSFSLYKMSMFLGSMWFMPIISTYGSSFYFLNLGGLISNFCDQGWSEEFGGQYINNSLIDFVLLNQVWQNNNLSTYLVGFIIWIYILMMLILFK
uniref:NADH-ubiquinone oxidoreductase chain 5 n=1 Tax=Phryganogryllacris xiai TaxID=1945534 RepID=A0A1Q1MPU8_9ORTH|nr:NADH dehydrogenase subunit 5 [Phryganogryllacris xiai]AQM40103.1 NADH dehydrogenase subunit 5 [Phryganogryllacris xiai]